MSYVSSLSSRPRLAAVAGLVLGAVVTVPFVVLTDQIERVALSALIALPAALAAWLWAKRSRSVNEQRLVEQRAILKQAEEAERNYRTLLDSLPLVTWLYEVGDRTATRYVARRSKRSSDTRRPTGPSRASS